MTQSQPPPHPYPAPQHAAPEPKKTPLAVKIVVIAAILVWVGGCGAIIAAIGGEDPTAVPAPTTAQPTPSAPPTAQSYASLLALRDAVIKAGYPCPRWERFAKDDGPEFVKEAGQCSDEDVLSIYPDEKAVQQQLDTSAGVVILIAGPNWTLNIPESHRERVATALGGKIVDEGELDPNADPNTEPPAEPEAAGIGDKVRDDGYEFVVSKVTCGVRRVGDQYASEKPQGQFCLIKMSVKNVGQDPITFSEENQALVDSKGNEHSPDDEAWIYLDDVQIFAEINPGNTLKTTVPFDIPKGAKPDYLLLKAGFWGFSEGVRVRLTR